MCSFSSTHLNVAARFHDDIGIISLGLSRPVVSLQMSIHIAAHQVSFAYLNIICIFGYINCVYLHSFIWIGEVGSYLVWLRPCRSAWLPWIRCKCSRCTWARLLCGRGILRARKSYSGCAEIAASGSPATPTRISEAIVSPCASAAIRPLAAPPGTLLESKMWFKIQF